MRGTKPQYAVAIEKINLVPADAADGYSVVLPDNLGSWNALATLFLAQFALPLVNSLVREKSYLPHRCLECWSHAPAFPSAAPEKRQHGCHTPYCFNPASLRNGKAGSPSDLERTRAAIESFDPATLASVTTQAERLQGLLEVIFECLTVPMALNDLVCLITTVLPAGGLTMPATGTIESLNQQQHPEPGPDASLDESTRIKNIWQWIAQLPVDQRRALLLNLRGGQGTNMIALLLQVTGAKPAELRDLLAMPAEQFEGIFNRLPLQDAEIAALFGRSRREIIALRQAAHRWLDRRRKGCSNSRGKKAEQRNRPE